MKLQIKHIRPYFFIFIPLFLLLLVFSIINQSVDFEKYSIQGTITDSAKTNTQIIDNKNKSFGIVIHGGAGNISKEKMSAESQIAYKTKLFEAIQTGQTMLENNDSAIYIVEAVIKILEDSPLFNAGKGAVFTHKGTNELDASIMNGKNKKAGAVAGVSTIKNPISAALEVMQHSKHVLLVGKGAEEFAKKQKLNIVPNSYFYTEKSYKSLQKAKKKENEKYGTVGCVVLDKFGNLAAGTSTGGMTNKKYGRVGDSPIIGAGTYADNTTCAISCTGHGEYFIRYAAAYDVAAQMKYANKTLKESAKNTIQSLKNTGGYGGLIGIDKNGNFCMEFSTKGMFRAYSINNEEPKIAMFE